MTETLFQFSPLLPWPLLAGVAVLVVLIAGWGLVRGIGGAGLRAVVMLVLLAVLVNPRAVRERSEPLADIVVAVVDRSASQALGDRRQQTEAALADLETQLAALGGVELRQVQVDGIDETGLFAALDLALASVPRERLAAVVAITDGQVHDVPDRLDLGVPFHVLLTGRPDEHDRRLRLRRAAGYGIVGREAEVIVRAEDPALEAGTPIAATLTDEAGRAVALSLPANQDVPVTLPVEHAGPILAEIALATADDEITTDNNRLVIRINGVRDRLRVLLISGEPNPGTRAWRDLLKSDPAVDLVHFTILRPPEKQDATPLRELALIPFPIRELFEERLSQFDLVIFDRYRLRGVLPSAYITAVANYVRQGGAVLLAAGPEYADPLSLQDSALGQIMPAAPTGQVIERVLRPKLSALGRRHPITADLPGGRADPPRWGRWYRQIAARTRTDVQVLLEGADGQPLLVIDRVEEGRVAQILTDQLWLWQRGHDGGGPQAELLRRLSHWLMREPELEEERLSAEAAKGILRLTRYSLGPGGGTAVVRHADGSEDRADFAPGRRAGIEVVELPVSDSGLHRIEARDANGAVLTTVVAGTAAAAPENDDLRSSFAPLAPLVQASGGGMLRLAAGLPQWRRVSGQRPAYGDNWLGVRAAGARRVDGVRDLALAPPLAVMGAALVLLVLAWRRESR